MTFRNHTTTVLLLATLTACQPAPAHADVFPESVPAGQSRPGWRPAGSGRMVAAPGLDYDFDPDRGPLLAPRLEDSIWFPSPWGTWGAGTAPLPLPAPNVVSRCRPGPAAVPGPLPLAGIAAAWGWARRLRRRVGQ